MQDSLHRLDRESNLLDLMDVDADDRLRQIQMDVDAKSNVDINMDVGNVKLLDVVSAVKVW